VNECDDEDHAPCENGDDCADCEYCCDVGDSGCEPGFCYEEECPCYNDCPYFNIEENPIHSCEVTVAEVDAAEQGCYYDCEGWLADFIATRYEACIECMTTEDNGTIGACAAMFESEGGDDGGGGNPDCMSDCPHIDVSVEEGWDVFCPTLLDFASTGCMSDCNCLDHSNNIPYY
jgi:hypothetical protein